jgi:hypothetical protein
MSMIRCERCERVIDAKDEGLEGIYGSDAPYEYLCPMCVEDISESIKLDPIEYQDQRIIQAFRQ